MKRIAILTVALVAMIAWPQSAHAVHRGTVKQTTVTRTTFSSARFSGHVGNQFGRGAYGNRAGFGSYRYGYTSATLVPVGFAPPVVAAIQTFAVETPVVQQVFTAPQVFTTPVYSGGCYNSVGVGFGSFYRSFDHRSFNGYRR